MGKAETSPIASGCSKFGQSMNTGESEELTREDETLPISRISRNDVSGVTCAAGRPAKAKKRYSSISRNSNGRVSKASQRGRTNLAEEGFTSRLETSVGAQSIAVAPSRASTIQLKEASRLENDEEKQGALGSLGCARAAITDSEAFAKARERLFWMEMRLANMVAQQKEAIRESRVVVSYPPSSYLVDDIKTLALAESTATTD